MAGVIVEKGKQIHHIDQPMTAVHVITGGKVDVQYPGGSYELTKGDVIGICELASEVHFLSYTTRERTSLLSYPISNPGALEAFLFKHPDVARVMLLSLFKQITLIIERSALAELSCSGLQQNLMADLAKCRSLAERFRISLRLPEPPEDSESYFRQEAADEWLNTYYLGLKHIFESPTEASRQLLSEPGVTMGLLHKGSLDFRKAFSVTEEIAMYHSSIVGYYFSSTGEDLFEYFTSLHYKMDQGSEEERDLSADIMRIISLADTISDTGTPQIRVRIQSYTEHINAMAPAAGGGADAATNTSILQELSGSMNAILGYAGLSEDLNTSIRTNVLEYKACKDRSSMDDNTLRLRKQLTEHFYQLYNAIALKALTDTRPPMAVKMFLYFGYLDEGLTGAEHAVTLYHLASKVERNQDNNIYPFFHWLQAIYRGEKEPSRNEFDEDYSRHIQNQKNSGVFTASQIAEMEKDTLAKVRYELNNMFPLANKVTCGRISTFCPLFSSDQIIKDLNSSFITANKAIQVLNYIRSYDYSAFYREALLQSGLSSVGKETVHLEFLPDLILMPNAGGRGIMWQEIEGKRRSSSGRMCISSLHMEDLKTTLLRLTGELRWELCKRIHGARWNDAAEHSLTSEYFDYIQFYRKNHDLNSDAKEKVKTSLQRARNSYKEMFVRDYIVWIMFEGNGSPRLNKVARRILFTHCPFSESKIAALEQSPLYSELLSQRNIQIGQRLHHLDSVMQKLRNSNVAVPEALEKEYLFTQGKV